MGLVAPTSVAHTRPESGRGEIAARLELSTVSVVLNSAAPTACVCVCYSGKRINDLPFGCLSVQTSPEDTSLSVSLHIGKYSVPWI